MAKAAGFSKVSEEKKAVARLLKDYVASGGFDGSVLVHRAESGELLKQFLPIEIGGDERATETSSEDNQ